MPRAPLAALLLAVGACGAPRFRPAGPSMASLSVERITLRWSNVYLLRRGDAALLVDSGSPGDRDDLARALGGTRPRAVVVTHAHADHAGGAAWLQRQGAAIVLGAGDAPTAARGRNEPLRPTSLLGALLATVFMFPFEPFTPDLAVPDDGREVNLGAYGFPELRVVAAAGHTPGSIVLLGGDVAFTGDMVKGGELFTRTPTEHLYQTDRLADHRALAAVLDRGPTRLYLGHSGPLAAGDVRAWLAGADASGPDSAVTVDLDARGERREGGDLGLTGGLRARYAVGRFGYEAGLDVRAGYLGRGIFAADAFPLGLVLRSGAGAVMALTAGAGVGGERSAGATHALVELDDEMPIGPTRLLLRASLGWRLGGPRYAGDVGSIADELTALVGLRLGRDRRWGDYVAGKGPYLAFTYRDLGGVQLVGVALGLDLSAGR